MWRRQPQREKTKQEARTFLFCLLLLTVLLLGQSSLSSLFQIKVKPATRLYAIERLPKTTIVWASDMQSGSGISPPSPSLGSNKDLEDDTIELIITNEEEDVAHSELILQRGPPPLQTRCFFLSSYINITHNPCSLERHMKLSNLWGIRSRNLFLNTLPSFLK